MLGIGVPVLGICVVGLQWVRYQGGWEAALYPARLWYIANVVPLTWPRNEFTPTAWANAKRDDQYKFSASLASDRGLKGRTRTQIVEIMGGGSPAGSTFWFYPLRRVGFQNLWWGILVEFEGERATIVRREIAWLD